MPTCIFCLAETWGHEPIDHPLPQAFGTQTLALPSGAVCAPCNVYLGANLDQNLSDHHHLALFIVLSGARGSGGRTRTAITHDFSFDPRERRLHIRVRPGEATIADGTLNVKSAGNRQFDQWKFSRGLHRVALGILAAVCGVDTALDPRFNEARRYVRRGQRREFRPYRQRVSGIGLPLRLGIARGEAATFAYINFAVSEFIVALDGDLRKLSKAHCHTLSLESGAMSAEVADREWLAFDRAKGQPGILTL